MAWEGGLAWADSDPGDLVYIHLAVATDDEEEENDVLVDDAVHRFLTPADEKAKSLGIYRSFLQRTYAESWQNLFERRTASTLEEMLAAAK